jgi:hypothetical protein
MLVKDFELFDLDETEKDTQEAWNIQDMSDIKNTQHLYNPVSAQREAEAKQTAAWKAHQEAIVKAGQLTSDITKGIQSGEKIEILFLKAIECISLITDDRLFYELNKNNLKNMYGFLME